MAANRLYYVAKLTTDEASAVALDWATDRFSLGKPEIENARLFYIPFCRLTCDYMARWSAEIGKPRSADYESARRTYEIAINAYRNLTDDGPDRNRRPIAPNRDDFIIWRSESGSHTDKWKSLMFPAAQHLGQNLVAWANELLPRIDLERGTVAPRFDAWLSLVPNWQEVMTPICRVDFDKAFRASVQAAAEEAIGQALPGDHRGLTVTLCEPLEFVTESMTVLPFFAVTYRMGDAHASCLVDGISGNVAGTKLSALRQAVQRVLGRGTRPAEPEMVTDSVVVPLSPGIALPPVAEAVQTTGFHRFLPRLGNRDEDCKMAEVVELWNSAAREMDWQPTRDHLVDFISWSFCIDAEYMSIPDGVMDDQELEMVLRALSGVLLDRARRRA